MALMSGSRIPSGGWVAFGVTLLLSAPAAAEEDPAAVDSLLAAADRIQDDAVRENLIKTAISHDRSGRAMHALARLLMRRGSPQSRQRAVTWLKKAILREREHPDYLATFAELQWYRLQRPSAYAEARRVLRIDPDHVWGLYWTGRFIVWSWEMTTFTDVIREDPLRIADNTYLAGKTGFYTEYQDLDLDDGIDFLCRAIRADPDHWPSHVQLGLAYFVSNRPDPLIDLFEAYRRRHPENRDAHFFVGLGHQMKAELDEAHRAYLQGLSQMSDDDRRFVQSIFLLREKKAEERGDPLPDEATIDRFWLRRDPLFLTPVNERMLEQCRRVAYANLRFTDPVNGREGWQTDRGQAYIRYGDPLTRRMTLSFAESRKEIWHYGPFHINFSNMNSWDSWRSLRAQVGLETVSFVELTERIPDHYEYPFQYDAPYQIGQFRGENGKTSVEIYAAFRSEQIAHDDLAPGIGGVDARHGLFLFDAGWDSLMSEVRRVRRLPKVTYASTRQDFLLASQRLDLDPGRYHLVGELEDQKTRTVGTFRDTLGVRAFGYDSLDVSSLLIALRIEERDDGNDGRNRFAILPNPLKRCPRAGRASFYFEVYNLARDAYGGTHYRLTYEVQVLLEDRIQADPDPEWLTAVSATYRGTRDWETHRLTLDMEDTAPGPRNFRVVVEDLLQGEKAVGMTQFRVTW